MNDEKQRLIARIAEIDRLEALFGEHPEYRIASLIHDKTCCDNHADGCGWCYESWEKIGHTRQRYIERANRVIDAAGIEQAIKVLEAL